MRIALILLTTASSVVLSGAALAADLPTHKAPMAPAPVATTTVFSWTGPYIGAFAGGNWAKVTTSDLTNPGFGGPALNSNGLTVGGLAGFNWGFSGFILGGEVEAGYDHRSASASYAGFGGVPTSVSDYGAAEGRARGRIGFGWNNWLLFAAGGGTVTDLRMSYALPGLGQELDRWRGGWNVGGGLEWAFNDHWILRGEYIYDRFGDRGYGFNAQNAAFDSQNVRLQESTARAAIAYKF